MNYIKNIPKIRKMARSLGTPLKSIDATGGGITFTLVVKGRNKKYRYESADEGVAEMVKILEQSIEKKRKPRKRSTEFP